MTVAEWVRQALRAASRREPPGEAERKLAIVRTAARHGFPTGEIAGPDGHRVRVRRRVVAGIPIDSNVPMHLVGAAPPLKADAPRLLERCTSDRVRLVTDARDVFHGAGTAVQSIRRIMSFDTGFGVA